ncbi:MAG: hypothetical protein PHQ40_08655 [Anaerolineaceae bacterium]|nr:hypothetical protein [Anaerolineaceae bacterium]
MDTIEISKRKVSMLLILLPIGLLAVAILWIHQNGQSLPFILHLSPTSSTLAANRSPVDPAQDAAVAGAKAFFSVDTSKGMQVWLDDLCRVSTQLGCSVDQNLIIPGLWTSLETTRVITTATAQAEERISSGVASTRGNAPMQIWKLTVALSAPWPVQKEPTTRFEALALVIQEGSVWKFERFLTDQEVQASAPEKQP